MTVREILYNVAILVGDSELADKINTSTESSSDEYSAKTKNMLLAYNCVLREIGLDFLPQKCEEQFNTSVVQISTLTYTPTKFLNAYDDNGNDVNLFVYPTYIKADKTPFTVVYEHLPKEQVITDTFDYENTFFGKNVFIYGTASEYCVMMGQYEEASTFESKFRNLLKSAPLKKVKKIGVRKDWGL